MTEHPERSQEAFDISGFSIVPVVVIEDENQKDVVVGYNLQQLIPALQLA